MNDQSIFDMNPQYSTMPAYMEQSVIVKDETPIPKKGFFKQIFHLPRDIQDMKTNQRTLSEYIQESARDISLLSGRVNENEKCISSFQSQLDRLNQSSFSYQEKVQNLSGALNPLMEQMLEIKQAHSLQIEDLGKSVRNSKVIIAFLVVMNVALVGFVLFTK